MSANFIVENEEITKDVMVEYEAVRQSGACNMLDFGCVQNVADQLGFYSLASLEKDGYFYILSNFGKLMSHFEIGQS